MKWLLESIKKKMVIRADSFRLKRPKRTSTGTGLEKIAGGKKRKLSGKDNDEGDYGLVKKQKSANHHSGDSDVAVRVEGHEDEPLLEVVLDKNNVLLDATLIKFTTSSSKHSICRIQVLFNVTSKLYFTLVQKWSASGELKASRKGLGDSSCARRAFRAQFKKLTGLYWSNRHESPNTGNYIFLDCPDEDKEPSLSASDAGDEIPPTVRETLEIIFQTGNNPGVASLVTNLSVHRTSIGKTDGGNGLRVGVLVLQKLSAHLLRDKAGAFVDEKLVETLRQCYMGLMGYTSIASGADSVNLEWVRKEREDLNYLRDVTTIQKLLGNASKQEDVAWRQIYKILGLKEMKLVSETSPEFKKLCAYFNKSFSGHHRQGSVVKIFSIERHGEAKRYATFRENIKAATSNRKLLWHGSRQISFIGIFSQGLRVNAGGSPISNENRGIYFADFAGKSLGYCRATRGNMALMLLCEVELGRTVLSEYGNAAAMEKVQHGKGLSLYVEGRTRHSKWCDAEHIRSDLRGIAMPDVDHGRHVNGTGKSLNHNEYVVFDSAQVRQRYLFQVQLV
ncbi:uncharacterized protein N7459_008045 [Penicillium hispanicum]|uniref:uncharacterized protein n=1 Tax=Penicillium hispanicum TaxID=1080232 RepID=UPI002541225B|nr:uncharacterized protein N7459_008045 [Penicillium hispanicum]KAJ5573618.1 hypothetical protein N7459_008045 [Penicillium hispanicum]